MIYNVPYWVNADIGDAKRIFNVEDDGVNYAATIFGGSIRRVFIEPCKAVSGIDIAEMAIREEICVTEVAA